MTVKSLQSDQCIGVLTIFCGGVGLDSAQVHAQRLKADRGPFPHVAVQIDTDGRTADFIDIPTFITLTPGKLHAIMADPERFGPIAVKICEHHGKYLNPEDVLNGSRTIRLLTQLAFLFHYNDLLRQLRTAIHRLQQQQRITSILPFFVSSSGGGTGSALQILLLHAFADPAFRRALTEGCSSSILQRPTSFVSEPYSLSQLHESGHESNIMANAYAFRIESELLERRGATKYIIHIGFSNSKGTILADPSQMASVLGTSLYQFQRSWFDMKSRLVDGADVAALRQKGYLGRDVAEHVFDSFSHGNGQELPKESV